MDEVLGGILRDGVKINLAVDAGSALVLGLTLFLALVLALTVYGKVIR